MNSFLVPLTRCPVRTGTIRTGTVKTGTDKTWTDKNGTVRTGTVKNLLFQQNVIVQLLSSQFRVSVVIR